MQQRTACNKKEFDFEGGLSLPRPCLRGGGAKREDGMFLPDKIKKLIGEESYKTDDIGMSGSCIWIFQDKVLKVQQQGDEAENEHRMMEYLRGRLPVPEVYAYEEAQGRVYLLMSKIAGQMACSHEYMSDPKLQCRMLAEGLRQLWSIDVSDCPSDQRLEKKLKAAAYNVEHGLVDLENVQPDTFGEKGFGDLEELLEWLYENRPKEEPVLSHGDYCLPNLLGIQEKVTGYIDLGRMGIADKWCDIALCCRSLSGNYSGQYGRGLDCVYTGYDEMALFEELDLKPDWEKIHYYILLDELF